VSALNRTVAWWLIALLLAAGLLPLPVDSAPLSRGDELPLPLPAECGGSTGPGGACCAYGYVYYDGVPVVGATVTVEGPGGSTAVATEPGELSDDPYFAVSLSDEPISASVGDAITLSVGYGGRSQSLAYQVVEDGQQVDLVLPAATSDTPLYYVSGSNDSRQIWRMNGDGSGRTYVRDGHDPDICPHDGRVLYTDGTDIHVMDANGNDLANLTPEASPPGSYISYNPDWSPDCSQIVYTAVYPSWRYTLVLMNADGSGKHALPSPPGSLDDWYPAMPPIAWSPDGQWIAFTSNSGGDDHIYRMHPDGSGITQLNADPGWYPTWSPDGSRVLYVGFVGLTPYPFVMDADGSNAHRIPNTLQAWWPYWLSDNRVMYVSGPDFLGNDLDIYIVDVDGANHHNLTNDPDYYRSPTAMPTYLPVATIHSVTPAAALQGRDTVTFRGSGQDADEGGEAIVAYRWRSSLDGVLGDQAGFTLAASELSLGTHTLYLQVQDDEGDWSPEVWRTLLVTDQPFDLDALILTNRERLVALYGQDQADAVMQKLDELAAATNGLVLQVELDPATNAAYTAWLANPTSFSHANAVADAIHDQIVAHLGLSPDLAYVVIAGDDRVIPFRRVRDRTEHPEHYYDEVPPNTTTGAALAADRTLTDDFYGDRVPTIPDDPGWDGHPLYLPDMAVGRLVETPDEIASQIDQFLASGEIEGGEAIVTGYDFLADSAQEMCSALAAAGLYPDCGLIGDSWTAAQFTNQVLNQGHDLVSYNGHADHYTIYTPQGAVSSDQVLNSAGDHAGTLFWTPGCHGALNVPPETPEWLDTVQALVSREALVLGNTGYGWGYRFSVGLSEQLMLNFTQHLLAGSQTTAGRAWVDAKQQYYLEELDFDYYDEKVLIEAAFYGIPMTRVISPGGQRAAAAPSAPRRSTVEQVGSLTVERIHYDFPALIAETTPQGTYYTYGGQAEHSDDAPIQPRYGDPLSTAEGMAHGAVLRAALGQELPGFDPVVDEATWQIGGGGDEPAFDCPAWFPGRLLSLNRTDGQSTLAIGLGQFHGTAQVERLYGAMDVDVYFGDSGDGQPPRLSSIESELQGNAVVIAVEADDPSGIHGMVVAYGDGNGGWSSTDLLFDGGAWRGDWLGNAAGEFFVQAVDGAGNVAVYPWDGRYMRPGDSYHPSQVFLPLIIRGEQ
jgi:hypothetical protein